jgi:hypothetical protein
MHKHRVASTAIGQYKGATRTSTLQEEPQMLKNLAVVLILATL